MTEEYRQQLKRQCSTKPFIYNLWCMITYENYIEWGPDNLSFTITDINNFTKIVLKKYLKTEQYSSFQRNLNYWYFECYNRSDSRISFKHQYFRRNILEYTNNIIRKTNYTSTSTKQVNKKRKAESSPTCSTNQLTDTNLDTNDPEYTPISIQQQTSNRTSRYLKRQKTIDTTQSLLQNDVRLPVINYNNELQKELFDIYLNKISDINLSIPTIGEIADQFYNHFVKDYITITIDEISRIQW